MTNAADFGAMGDGITDDTEAIQHAIDESIGQLSFPRGTYRITRSIVVNLSQVGWTSLSGQSGTARIVMDGSGPAITLKGNQHLVYPDRTPLANLLFTLLVRAGVPVDKVGDSTGELVEV